MNTTGLLAAGVVASLSMATVPHAAAQVIASLNTLTIDMPGTDETPMAPPERR